MSPAPADSAQGCSIAAVERDTGLSKDTLRVWERRYNFPQPGRDAHGERLFCTEQAMPGVRVRAGFAAIRGRVQ